MVRGASLLRTIFIYKTVYVRRNDRLWDSFITAKMIIVRSAAKI